MIGACFPHEVSLPRPTPDFFSFSVAGRELSLAQQYSAVGVLSFPIFWVAGAGSAVFWVIGTEVDYNVTNT